VASADGSVAKASRIAYSVANVPEGKYLIYAIVDANGDGDKNDDVDSTDFIGSAASTWAALTPPAIAVPTTRPRTCRSQRWGSR
jgi:hypothetical protein